MQGHRPFLDCKYGAYSNRVLNVFEACGISDASDTYDGIGDRLQHATGFQAGGARRLDMLMLGSACLPSRDSRALWSRSTRLWSSPMMIQLSPNP